MNESVAILIPFSYVFYKIPEYERNVWKKYFLYFLRKTSYLCINHEIIWKKNEWVHLACVRYEEIINGRNRL